MDPLAGFCIIINIRMVFCHIRHDTDIYQLFYDGFCCFFEIRIIQDFLRRQKTDRLCVRHLLLPAVSGVARLSSVFFPAVWDFLMPD